ncbi:hypothetical protein MIND_00772500 [Mycena indigotica]|uniref:F-box domain-containing protein n=1 Tax=Mycena indigotica TaxID=2126181 RepID=A0A8H6SLP7_9AGAR|nr:uncharacterized protein MIND_00772500 [Mycena indigotica]KAF7302060.1 hypothetical protein MIND_00772500 [Mycena indigotica]
MTTAPNEQPRNVINTLPTELMIEIFDYCRFELDIIAPDLMDPTTAPRLLMHVCQHWRYIVTTTPQLWDAFLIDVSERVWETEFEECIRRSADRRLTVTLLSGWEDPLDGLDYANLRMFAQYCHRVKHLKIDITQMIFLLVNQFLSTSVLLADRRDHLQFPALKSFSIARELYWDDPTMIFKVYPITAFSEAPELQNLLLGAIPAAGFKFDYNAYGANLVHFGSVVESLNELNDLFSDMPNLNSAAVVIKISHNLEGIAGSLRAAPTVHHACLQELKLDLMWGQNGLEPSVLPDIVACFMLPALKSLVLPYMQNKKWGQILAERSPQLAELTISGSGEYPWYETTQGIIDLFKPLPTLRLISVQDATPEFLRSFFDAYGSELSIFPMLQELLFERLSPPEIALYAFLMFAGPAISLRKHSAPLVTLRSVTAQAIGTTQDVYPPPEYAAILQKLASQGIEFDISYSVESDDLDEEMEETIISVEPAVISKDLVVSWLE